MATSFSNESRPSNQVLAHTADRSRIFLFGIRRTPEVLETLRQYGLTDKEMAHGWSLLQRADGYTVPVPPQPANLVQEAMDEIEAWADSAMRRAHAAFGRLHEQQDVFVFEGLEPRRGPEALVATTTFLDRLDALESAPERKPTRKADHAALATLETRGIDKAQRLHIRKQIHLVQTPPKAEEAPAAVTETLARRTDDLIALWKWYEDWAETARTVITKREHKIRLGLAKRRARKSDAGSQPPVTATVVPPTPPALPALPPGPAQH